MKVSCEACGSKYTVSDEKVHGKTVKIRCKKCGATIVAGGAPEAIPGGPSGAMASTTFGVLVADSDQRTLSGAEIRGLFSQGTVTESTYVWRDGMTDWAPLAEVADLVAYVRAMDEDQPTRMGSVPAEIFARGRAGGSERPPEGGLELTRAAAVDAPPTAISQDEATTMFNTSAAAAAALGGPSAARAARRPAAGVAARSPFEESLPRPVSPARESGGAPRAPTAPTELPRLIADGDASGMIDIRMLQASRQPAPKPVAAAKVDDLFGASAAPSLFDAPGFGASMPILDLNAPSPVEPPPPPAPAPVPAIAAMAPMPIAAPRKSSVGLFIGLGLGGLVLVAAAVVVAFFVLERGDKREAKVAAVTEDTSRQAAADPSAATSAVGDPEATTGSAPASAVPDAAEAAPTRDPKKPKTAAELKKEAEEAKKKAKEDDAKKKEDDAKKKAKEDDAKKKDEPAPPAGGADGVAFDRAAAMSALSGAAGAARSCKTPDGPTGSGRASVTFAPNGRPTAVNLEGPFGGTSVGSCITARFRGTKVPPFGGAPVTVVKSFSVN